MPEKNINGLAEFMDLGIQFYCHDTTTAKTELLSLSDCQKEVYVRKEKILYGIGNWRSYTRHEASAIIEDIKRKVVAKFDDVIIEERYEIKRNEPTK